MPVSRTMVLVSCTIVVILTNAGQASFALLVPFMEEDFGWSRSAVTLPFMVAMIVWGLSSPIWGKLADDYGARPIMLAGVVLMAIGFAVMGFAQNLWQLTLAFGVLVGGAKGAASHTIGSLLISKHYDAANRTKAVGVLQAASPLHPVIFAPLFFLLLTAFDWRAAVLATSATLIAIALPLAWLGVRDPEGEKLDARARLGWIACLPYLRNRSMVLLFVARIACGLAVFQGVHMVTFAISKGHTMGVGVAAVSVVGISAVVCALLFGWLADRYGRAHMLGLTYAVRGVGSLLLALTMPNELWFFLLVAITSGPVFATIAIQNVIYFEAVGPRLAGVMLGLSFVVHQFASAIGPQVASILFDATGSYNQYQLAVGFILLFSAAITFNLNLKDIGKVAGQGAEPRLPEPALSPAPAGLAGAGPGENMFVWKHALPTLALLVVLAGCAPGAPTPSAVPASGPVANSGAPKRITVAVVREQDLRPISTGPQVVATSLVHSGLTIRGEGRVRQARLADAVPSLENGLWKLLLDGRMETTWRLRQGARWHDGVPVTSADLTFSLQVGRDPEMAGFSVPAYSMVEDVSAPDAATLTITWSEPFIDVNTVLGEFQVGLLPKHLLEEAYRTDKTALLDLPYWTSDFVGAGPYRLRQWMPGIGLSVEANPDYVLGRPRVDQIEVTLIPDPNTMAANILAGTVDVTGSIVSLDLGLQLRDQWRDGRIIFNLGGDTWVAMFPQFVEPQPGVVGDVRFRRALTHAIDRAEINDTLIAGMSPVAHTFLSPNQPAYREIEASAARYDYDPRRAAQLLEELGFRRGPDGYRDATDRRLEVELRARPEDEHAKTASAVAAYWQRLGVGSSYLRLTQQQFQDQQYAGAFPAFMVVGGPNDVAALRNLRSSQARLPSNNYRVSGSENRARYINPEFDALLTTYFATVPEAARIQALGEIIRHMSDQLTTVGIYYNPRSGAAANRVQGVSQEWVAQYITWNAHEWDVRD